MLNFNFFTNFKAILLSSVLIFAISDNAKAIPFTKVILDAGHGGHDLGGTFGLTYEKHLALDVVRRVDTYLKSQGIATKLTRARDEFISLQRRARIANAESGAIFVSIHFNHARSRKAAGIETFYHTKNKNSLKLAHMIQSASSIKQEPTIAESKSKLSCPLKKQPTRSVLECAFLTNSSDRFRALDPEYRQRIAEAVAMGIIKFRQSN